MNICTIAGARSLARARVMASSLERHHPEASLVVLLSDVDPAAIEPVAHARMLGAEELLGEDLGLLAAANDPDALAITLLPALVRAVFAAGAPATVFVDAGQRIVGRLDELDGLLATHDVVLAARRYAPEHHGAFTDAPGEGAFSRRLVGFRAGAVTDALLDAWPRLFAQEHDRGAGAVRRWVDGISALVPTTGVVRDPGFATDRATLASWAAAGGLGERDGALSAAGSAVRDVDFGELDPERPHAWFATAGGLLPDDAPVLGRLVEEHAKELLAAGWRADGARPAAHDQLADGLRLTATIRGMIAGAIEAGRVSRSPYCQNGREDLYEYLNEPGDRGEAAGLTRLHIAIWRARQDLREGYPHIDGPDGVGFAGWMCLNGAEQEGLVPALLPPTPEVAFRDADPHRHESPPLWGVNVVGFLTAELGVGEAARLLLAGLDAREVPALPIQGQLMPPSRREASYEHVGPDDAAFPINILCVNGDGIPVFAREAGRSFFAGRYSIAQWWWEAGEPPASWAGAYEFIDEVWVASQHVYDALAPRSPVPVLLMRLPIVEPSVPTRTRAELGLPDGFLFLCVFDYHSVAARKNPAGAIEAFCRAFPEGSGPKLVVKSINSATHPDEHARVQLAAAGRGDVVMIEDYLSSAEKNAMIAACDCYVSLHRSEGLGIPVAEAMLLAKPVIATRYGGTLEFMTDNNSYLVDWQPVNVGENAYPYAPGATWADPDLEHAAALMRGVVAEPEEARARGRLARSDVAERHSPSAAGEIMERRLRLVHARMQELGARSLNLAHLEPVGRGEEMRGVIADPPLPRWGTGLRTRLARRWAHPLADWAVGFARHQAFVDEETRAAIERLDARVSEVARALHQQQSAQHAETLAALRRIERGTGPADAEE